MPRRPAVSSEPADDVVRVAYVPEVVKREIREQVKSEVIAEARKENWGSPSSGPEWVSKFTLYGDIRIRAEEVINHAGNDNSGSLPELQRVINTGAPLDTAGNVFSPQYNVDQNRNRERMRARMGATVDLYQRVYGGWPAPGHRKRQQSGGDGEPGPSGRPETLEGGDFSEVLGILWLDRALYQVPGGRTLVTIALDGVRPSFDNPFFSTPLIWANDIGFDGVAASIPVGAQLHDGDMKPFLVLGAFPVFNTDLNYATNQPAKFKSYDKWLFAGQCGVRCEPGSQDFELKAAAALYQYREHPRPAFDTLHPTHGLGRRGHRRKPSLIRAERKYVHATPRHRSRARQ